MTTAVEHHAVLDPLDWMATDQGAVVDHLDVDDRRCRVLGVEGKPCSDIVGADGIGDGGEPIDGAVEVVEVGGVPKRHDQYAIGQPPGARIGFAVPLGWLRRPLGLHARLWVT